MRLSPLGTAALLILAVAAFVSVASAIPVLPHAFCGDVVLNGAPAPDGTEISATVSEGTLVPGTQNPVTTVGGSFGKGSTSPLLVQGEIADGAIITFHVNGVSTGMTSVFEAGGGPTTVQISVGSGATPGTGGSSSSGGEIATPRPTEVPVVTPGTTEPGEETVTSPAATTPPVVTETPPPGRTQTAAQTTAPKETPLVYAPVASIAGAILIFLLARRQ